MLHREYVERVGVASTPIGVPKNSQLSVLVLPDALSLFPVNKKSPALIVSRTA